MKNYILNNGNEIPALGLGVWQVNDAAQCKEVVSFALKNGYRLIDTATVYQNEAAVGEGILDSGIPRDEIFVCSKLWIQDMGYQSTKDAIDRLLTRMKLDRMEYCGHTVNFKTHRQSYKIKKTIENPPEQWKVFRNTHEAIVDEDTFQRVQELRRNKRRPARTGKSNLFSGVAYCADCGEKLYYCTTQNFEDRQDHFVCSTSRKKGKDVCGTHFIRAVVLEKGVLNWSC